MVDHILVDEVVLQFKAGSLRTGLNHIKHTLTNKRIADEAEHLAEMVQFDTISFFVAMLVKGLHKATQLF